MSKNKNKVNSHATADKVTCPYCDSEALNLGFNNVSEMSIMELPGDKLYFCKSCFKPFIYEPQSNQGGMIKGGRNKIGRNEKCLCGSGVKYKKCYGKDYIPAGGTQWGF
jgi:hypothetical protein